MKKIKLIIAALAIVSTALATIFVLQNDAALVMHPKGVIARDELKLFSTNILLMLIVIAPTMILLFLVAWKYRAKNSKIKQNQAHSHGPFAEVLLWIIPSVVIAAMTVLTWYETHKLDPYRPLQSEVKPLTIQVVALDWKWLFIYPEQDIATLNFVQFPERTPIHFELSADGSPINSFWIPELSGQIYSMAGMTTQLHVMADGRGTYAGRAAEINGKGYASMTFTAKSTSQEDFEAWVANVKQSPHRLDGHLYDELLKPSQNDPILLYADVEKDLYRKINKKYEQ